MNGPIYLSSSEISPYVNNVNSSSQKFVFCSIFLSPLFSCCHHFSLMFFLPFNFCIFIHFLNYFIFLFLFVLNLFLFLNIFIFCFACLFGFFFYVLFVIIHFFFFSFKFTPSFAPLPFNVIIFISNFFFNNDVPPF